MTEFAPSKTERPSGLAQKALVAGEIAAVAAFAFTRFYPGVRAAVTEAFASYRRDLFDQDEADAEIAASRGV